MELQGVKTLDYDSDLWADHDERCHDPMDMFIDDVNYDDGHMWDCCEKEMDHPGCVQPKAHSLVRYEVPNKRARYQ